MIRWRLSCFEEGARERCWRRRERERGIESIFFGLFNGVASRVRWKWFINKCEEGEIQYTLSPRKCSCSSFPTKLNPVRKTHRSLTSFSNQIRPHSRLSRCQKRLCQRIVYGRSQERKVWEGRRSKSVLEGRRRGVEVCVFFIFLFWGFFLSS